MNPFSRRVLIALAAAATVALVGAPLTGIVPVVRLPAVLVPALALALLVWRPWRASPEQWAAWRDWTPPDRVMAAGALFAAATLFWFVWTRFESGELNAVDFTVYFDRPCAQTIAGRPLYIETTDYPQFSSQSALTHHAYWGMFALCSLYAVHATPFWLLAVSVISVTAGAVYVLRTLCLLGAPGIVAAVSAVAFLLNDNTARALNYGFHPEVMYAWFIPWML